MSVATQSQALKTVRTLSHIKLVQSTRSLDRCTVYNCCNCKNQHDTYSAGAHSLHHEKTLVTTCYVTTWVNLLT